MASIGPHSFVLKLAETMAQSSADTDIGGEITYDNVSLSARSPVFYPMTADGAGGSTRVQYAKIDDVNTHLSESVSDYGIFLANAIDDITTNGAYSFAGDAEDDGKVIRVRSFLPSSDPVQATATISDGEASVTTLMAGPVRITIHDSVGQIAMLVEELVIYHDDVEVGRIPAGGSCASNEIDMALEPALDDDTAVANPHTAPAGLTFSRPRTAGDRLLVNAGSGTFPAGGKQGIWLRWTVEPEMIGARPLACYPMGYWP